MLSYSNCDGMVSYSSSGDALHITRILYGKMRVSVESYYIDSSKGLDLCNTKSFKRIGLIAISYCHLLVTLTAFTLSYYKFAH